MINCDLNCKVSDTLQLTTDQTIPKRSLLKGWIIGIKYSSPEQHSRLCGMIIYMSTGDGSERFGGGGSDAGSYQPDYSVTGQNAPGVNERMVAKMPSDPGITSSEIGFYLTLTSLGALPIILPIVYMETNNPGAIMRIMSAISGSFSPMIFGQ